MTDLPRLSVRAIAAAVRNGQSSAVAQAQACLARLAAYDAIQPQIWISRPTHEAVLAAAAAIDARVAADPPPPPRERRWRRRRHAQPRARGG